MSRETKQQGSREQDQQQTRRNQQSGQRAQPSNGGTSGGTAQGTSMTTGGGDRERSIDATREQAPRTGATSGLARRDGFFDDTLGSHFARMERMAEDMDRLLGQFGFGRSTFGLAPTFGALAPQRRPASRFGSSAGASPSLWNPQVEILERGDTLVVRADLPGIRKEDVDVSVEDGMLTIRGERRDEREENEDGFYRSERSYGQFYRAIPIPDGIDDGACDARYADGVLEVTLPLPKQEQKKPKRLSIR